MIDKLQLPATKNIASKILDVTAALKASQAETVSIPEDVASLGRPQTGPVAATTPPQPTQAPPESKAGSGSMKRPPKPKAG